MHQSATSVGFKTYEEGPSTFKCADFEGTCCESCHKQNFVLMLFPWSLMSAKHQDRMPDLGMGLRAEVCCGKFHIVRELPREWWVRHYAAKNGWNKDEAERLVQATDTGAYLRLTGEIASKYWRIRNPGYATGGRPATSRPSQVRRSAGPSRSSGCPSCGKNWDGIVCNNCGHS